MSAITDHRLEALARHSVAVIAAGQAASGAYVASPTFSVYRYCWFRDGAFTADAMSRVGEASSADAFFRWCSDVLVARAERTRALVATRASGGAVDPHQLLHCRYTLEGLESEEEWWNFQLDGYGTWLWALGEHAGRHGRSLGPYAEAVELCVRYLSAFWQDAGYDWWEEHPDQQHVSTLAAIYAGLRAASSWETLGAGTRDDAATSAVEIRATVLARGVHAGRFAKWLDGEGVDASLLACATPFRLVEPDHPLAVATAAAVEEELAPGGIHRYRDDTYYGGGEWLLLTALLGWYYLEVGKLEEARAKLEWVAAQARPNGDLPEQVAGHLLAPDQHAPWVERWGPVAAPLLWSHAMYLTLAAELGVGSGRAGTDA